MPRMNLFAGALLVVVLSMVAQAADSPVRLAKADADKATTAILKDRTDTEAWLKGDPTSYLAAVARVNFEGRRALTVGRAADNDVRLDSPEIAAHHLRVTVQGPKFL